MNKKELINTISDATNLTKKEITNVLNLIVEKIIEKVSMGETVRLVGFGSFYSYLKTNRVGKNPKTSEILHLESSQTIKFSAGKFFKENVSAKQISMRI